MSHRLGQLNCIFAAEFELKDMKLLYSSTFYG